MERQKKEILHCVQDDKNFLVKYLQLFKKLFTHKKTINQFYASTTT